MEVGTKVRPACRKGSCRNFRGTVIALRSNREGYTHQIQWEQCEQPDWYKVVGLERT